MRKAKSDLLKRCQECMANPIADILENFSLEKSKEYYSKWDEAWENGMYSNNPATQKEKEEFNYRGLEELSQATELASFFYNNIKNMPHCKNVRYEISNNKITVHRMRLKTFNEWLHDGLQDALTQHYKDPEDGIRKMLAKEWGGGLYGNVDIHLWLEGKINDEAMQRMGRYEPCQSIEDRDLERDIEEAIKALEGGEKKEGDVTVLTLKV